MRPDRKEQVLRRQLEYRLQKMDDFIEQGAYSQSFFQLTMELRELVGRYALAEHPLFTAARAQDDTQAPDPVDWGFLDRIRLQIEGSLHLPLHMVERQNGYGHLERRLYITWMGEGLIYSLPYRFLGFVDPSEEPCVAFQPALPEVDGEKKPSPPSMAEWGDAQGAERSQNLLPNPSFERDDWGEGGVKPADMGVIEPYRPRHVKQDRGTAWD